MSRRLPVVLVCAVLSGCGANPLQHTGDPPLDQRPPVAQAVAGDTFRLQPGEIADVRLGAETLRVAFIGVSGDSRCPRGVECVWAGEAAAKLQISRAGGAWKEVELHTPGESGSVQDGPHLVELLDIEPYPIHGVVTAREDYVAVLRVLPLRTARPLQGIIAARFAPSA